MKNHVTAEQKARDMLERMGVPDAQEYSAGDLVELANLIADADELRQYILSGGDKLVCTTFGTNVVAGSSSTISI